MSRLPWHSRGNATPISLLFDYFSRWSEHLVYAVTLVLKRVDGRYAVIDAELNFLPEVVATLALFLPLHVHVGSRSPLLLG
jgi:hypothetical protein